VTPEQRQKLIEGLEKMGPIKPGKLRQGCYTFCFIANPDGTLRSPTEEELDEIEARDKAARETK
jgi:hypothetical protein